jgi:hypothetical protein
MDHLQRIYGDLPIKNGDCPVPYMKWPKGNHSQPHQAQPEVRHARVRDVFFHPQSARRDSHDTKVGTLHPAAEPG